MLFLSVDSHPCLRFYCTYSLYSVLCGRSNRDIELLKKAYFKIHSKDLGQMLRGELSGKFENLILNALQASEETFDPEYHTEAKMKEDVERLYKMGQGRSLELGK